MSDRFSKLLLLVALLIPTALLLSGCPPSQNILVDFEDPALGSIYHVGDTITDSGVTMTGGEYFYYGGGSTTGGSAIIQKQGDAGGSGQELWISNINISFNFGGACSDLTLYLGEYGGDCNIEINGDLRKFLDFADIDGLTIGGVTVSFSLVAAGYQGVLTLTGTINSFSIGGQEFCIDTIKTERL